MGRIQITLNNLRVLKDSLLKVTEYLCYFRLYLRQHTSLTFYSKLNSK